MRSRMDEFLLCAVHEWKLIFSKFTLAPWTARLRGEEREGERGRENWPHCSRHYIDDMCSAENAHEKWYKLYKCMTERRTWLTWQSNAKTDGRRVWRWKQNGASCTRVHINSQLKFCHSADMSHAKRRHFWRCALLCTCRVAAAAVTNNVVGVVVVVDDESPRNV